MKKKILGILLCLTMIGAMTGCGSKPSAPADTGQGEVQGEEAQTPETESQGGQEEVDGKTFDGETITLLVAAVGIPEGFNAVCEAAEEKLGIKVDVEIVPGGDDGTNIIKARLASGDMADILDYSCGSLMRALNPEEYFADITDDFGDRLVDSFVEAASVDGKLYGIPSHSSEAGAILYNKELYEKYDLEVPTTWEQFLDNCDVLKEAGEIAVLGTGGDSWTSQLAYLGDHYNVLAAEPDFARKFEAGEIKYADFEAGLASFQKIADLPQYMNSDHMATTYDDGCDMMMEDQGAHWFVLTRALGNMYGLYGDEVNKIGCFGVPGTDPENSGLTVWNPSALFMNKNTEHEEAVKAFMEFYISDEALDIYAEIEPPVGPYCVKDYKLPDECFEAVKEMQERFFDTGRTAMALEFQTAVKGANCASICQELESGQTTAAEAAAKYDEDCKKQAVQLGLNW